MPEARQQLQDIVQRAGSHVVMPVRVSLLAEHLATTDDVPVRASGRHHHLKTTQPFWDAIVDGSKTFDYRVNDRGFQPGDVVHLWEYLQHEHKHGACEPEKNWCGAWNRQIVRRIGFLLAAGPRIPLGDHVVFSLLPMGGA